MSRSRCSINTSARSGHLFLEVLREVGGRLRDAVGKAHSDRSGPHQQVEFGFRAYFTWVAQHERWVRRAVRGRDPPRSRVRVRSTEGRDPDRRRHRRTDHGRWASTRSMRRLLAYAIVGLAETTSRHWLVNDLDVAADLSRTVRRPRVGRPARVARLKGTSALRSAVVIAIVIVLAVLVLVLAAWLTARGTPCAKRAITPTS